jgi:hypothetical protein
VVRSSLSLSDVGADPTKWSVSESTPQHINADKLESAFIIGLLEVIVGIAYENRF